MRDKMVPRKRLRAVSGALDEAEETIEDLEKRLAFATDALAVVERRRDALKAERDVAQAKIEALNGTIKDLQAMVLERNAIIHEESQRRVEAETKLHEVTKQRDYATQLVAQLQQSAEIRDDMEAMLTMLSEALGVPHEPHQTWHERILERAEECASSALRLDSAAAAWQNYKNGVSGISINEAARTLDAALEGEHNSTAGQEQLPYLCTCEAQYATWSEWKACAESHASDGEGQ